MLCSVMGSSSKTIVACLQLFFLVLLIKENNGTEDKYHWRDLARSELAESLKYSWNTNTAKNVIIFLGDGMSPETITASRIFNGGEESYLAWEKFPHVGLLKVREPGILRTMCRKKIKDPVALITVIIEFLVDYTNRYLSHDKITTDPEDSFIGGTGDIFHDTLGKVDFKIVLWVSHRMIRRILAVDTYQRKIKPTIIHTRNLEIILQTYDSDKQVPDSASTATALFSGVKTNYGVSGLDARVQRGDCEASLDRENHLSSILSWAQDVGKDTGFVTTTRITHATPSALFAHSAERNWECESIMPASAERCKDIARQLIEDEPGRNIKVIMGGGRQMLQSNSTARPGDPINTWGCYSQDGRKLVEDWATDKVQRNFTQTVVQNTGELLSADPEETDFLLGVFANGHMSMDWERLTGPEGQPSLEEMTTTAVKILQKSKEGFVLMVEAGLIDIAHHRGHAAQALRETIRLSEAIDATLKLVDTSETLIIVTSDHGHALTFQGISDRGADILGISEHSSYDNIPYTTLGYSTGGPNNMAYEVYNGTTAVRKDPTSEDTTAFTYSQQAAVISDEAKHGGVDIAVYAIGPYAHLFHSTHEQNFVAHVAAYSAKIGEYSSSRVPSSKACFLTLSMVLVPLLRSR